MPAPTYDDQLRVCCETVAHRVIDFDEDHYLIQRVNGRVCYTEAFISFFANLWAPGGAENDPHGLNANWFSNAKKFYVEEQAAIRAAS